MRKTTTILASLLTAATTAMLGLVAQPAIAAENTPPVGAIEIFEMKRGGVNHEIAEAHGYEVRVDANGIEYPVKKDAIGTQDEIVYGVCGSSWVQFTAVDTAKNYTTVYTGFQLNSNMAGAVYVDWRVNVVDNFGVSNWTWHDPTASVHFWSAGKGFTAGGNTQVRADVVQPSIATLWDGTICFSHGPWDTVNL